MYSSTNDNNLASEMKKLAPDHSLYFRTHFDDRSKMLTYYQTSLKLLFAYKLAYKKSKSVKRSNWFSFQGATICKRQGRAALHTPDINKVK